MASTVVLTSKLFSMMLMMVVGFVIVRLKVMKTEDTKMLSTLVVYILQPCLIVHAFEIELTSERLTGFIGALILSFATFVVWIVLATLLGKIFHLDAIDQCTMIYPNAGNLILPLVSMVLGDEMVFYASAMQVPFNCFAWTHANAMISGEKSFNLKKVLLNPNVFALIVGLVLMISGLRFPGPISTVLDGFGDMVGPLSMLTIGMTIAGKNLIDVFKTKRAYPIIFGRLIVFPMVMLGLLYATGILTRMPILIPILQVTFMSIAAPPASTVAQLAVVHDNEPVKASIYSVIGNLFCVLTMPFILWLYQNMFG